jgi:hypothetical protein
MTRLMLALALLLALPARGARPRGGSPGTRRTAATWTAGSDLATNGLQIRPSQPNSAAVLSIDPAKI